MVETRKTKNRRKFRMLFRGWIHIWERGKHQQKQKRQNKTFIFIMNQVDDTNIHENGTYAGERRLCHRNGKCMGRMMTINARFIAVLQRKEKKKKTNDNDCTLCNVSEQRPVDLRTLQFMRG